MTDAPRTLPAGSIGEHAITLEALDGERLTLACPIGFAPGRPLSVSVAVEPPLSLSLKTIGSRRRDDGRFEVRGRLVSLRREERARLEALLGVPGADVPE